MSLKQILGVTQRIGVQLIRSRWTIPYLVLFPLFFIGLYWFGFSASPIGENQTFSLGIINEDVGFSNSAKEVFQNETIMGNWSLEDYHTSNVLESGFGTEFSDLLADLKYSSKTDSKNIFETIILNSESQADLLIKNRDLDIVMILPPQFTNVSLALLNGYWKNTYGLYFHEYIQSYYPSIEDLPINISVDVRIKGDESYINFQLANSVLSAIIERYQDLTPLFDGPGGSIFLRMNETYQISLETYSLFGLSIPGLIAFGIIIQPSLISLFFCMEFRPHNPTFDRIRLSPSSAKTYILGTLLVQIPVMIIQAFILFLSSILMGFQPAGDLLLAYLIALTIFPFSVALLYLTTAFLSNEDVVGTVLGFGAPFIGFMSGAFIEVPKIVLLAKSFPTASGFPRDFLIWDLLPLTHTVNALRQVLLFNFDFSMVQSDLIMSLILSMIYFGISIALFWYFRFKR